MAPSGTMFLNKFAKYFQVITIVIFLLCTDGQNFSPGESPSHSLENGLSKSTVAHFGSVWAQELSSGEKISCDKVTADFLNCDFNYSCVYGEEVNVTCKTKEDCSPGNKDRIAKSMICRFCYQTDRTDHKCNSSEMTQHCGKPSNTVPRPKYTTTCTVNSSIICLGRRQFKKNVVCNFTRGYSWSTALLLSIVLGGFGIDRFYLGMWQEGIGKLFSFGGLGVWTLVDVILIATGYLGPDDGSLYIY